MAKGIILILCSIFTLAAQDKTSTLTATLEKQLQLVTAKQQKHDAHIKKITNHLKVQDTSIEKQVKEIVDLISKFSDSGDSGTRIIRHKEQAIDGLTRSIKNYSDLRKRMNQELVYAKRYPSEDIQNIKDWLDKKIELRVKQITQITKSLGTYKEKHGWYNNNSRERSNAERADRERDKLARDMEKGKEELTEKVIKLEKQLDNVNSKVPMADIANEITALCKKIDLLESTIKEIKYGDHTKAKKMSRTGASTLDKDLRSMIRDVKSEAQAFNKGLESTIRLLSARKQYNEQIDKLEAKLKILKESKK